jgi:hypothetical protein
MLSAEHAEELRAVAERDSSETPSGMVMGARLDGRLVAARSISDGRVVADPFVHTAEIQTLLAKRVAQISGTRTGGLRHALARLSAQSSSASSRVAA